MFRGYVPPTLLFPLPFNFIPSIPLPPLLLLLDQLLSLPCFSFWHVDDGIYAGRQGTDADADVDNMITTLNEEG